jgi:hypothetical protein
VSAGLHSVEVSAKVDSNEPILAAPVDTTVKYKQRRQPLIGVRNCFSLPVVSKKERPFSFRTSAQRLRLLIFRNLLKS